MKLLMDTHVMLWALGGPSRLGKRSRRLIASGEHDVYVSAVSIAEIAIKESIGKLRVPDNLADLAWDTGFEELPLNARHADRLRELPWHHKDPFDRLLVSQAQVEQLCLVTADRQCMQYNVEVVDAHT